MMVSMTENRSAALAPLLLAVLVGCGSGPEKKDPEPKKPALSRADSQAIEDHIVHLNNDNTTERWRAGLVDLAGRGPIVKEAVVKRLRAEYEKSLTLGGSTSLGLNAAGRARAVYVVGAVGMEEPAVRDWVKTTLEDPSPKVQATAASALAESGDPAALPVLIAAAAQVEGPEGDKLLEALEPFARPEYHADFVKALSFENLDALEPLVGKTLVEGERAAKLRDLLRDAKNPAATAFAIRALAADKDVDALPLIRNVLKRGLDEPRLRAEVIAAQDRMAREPGQADAALVFYREELALDPADAADLARRLRGLGTPPAIEALAQIARDAERAEGTREAALRVLAKLDEESARDQDPTALRRAALPALRDALEAGGERAQIAIRGLGAFGDGVSDTSRLVKFSRRGENLTEFGADLVAALGTLGSRSALAYLVRLLKSAPELREQVQKTLGSKPARSLPLFELVDYLKAGDAELRASSFAVLEATTGENFGYNPKAEELERDESFRKWEAHARELIGG